jgi:hypothetical protein
MNTHEMLKKQLILNNWKPIDNAMNYFETFVFIENYELKSVNSGELDPPFRVMLTPLKKS